MPGQGAAVTQQDHTRERIRTTVHARACARALTHTHTHTHTHTCHDSVPFSRRLRYAARTRELAAGPEASSADAADVELLSCIFIIHRATVLYIHAEKMIHSVVMPLLARRNQKSDPTSPITPIPQGNQNDTVTQERLNI